MDKSLRQRATERMKPVTVAFTKMEGCGNDYIYVNSITQPLPIDRAGDLAKLWSDRHFGIGADGLIVLARDHDDDDALRMLMWNADGSRGAMCGNGLRCLARFAEVQGHTSGTSLVIMTDSGSREIELIGPGYGSGDVITQMGKVTCTPQRTIEVAGGRYDFICGDAGNPHAVTFVDDVESADVERIGAAMQSLEAFPDGVNVEFVQALGGDRIKQRTFERGSGETLACGTGAAVAALAARQFGNIRGRVAHVELRGGTLLVIGEGPSLAIEGPARSVFSGEIEFSR
ncbi:MAG: diaminopimelate epimerase [Planctomycetota bacterium]|jgi:diaminopimelate epimerase